MNEGGVLRQTPWHGSMVHCMKNDRAAVAINDKRKHCTTTDNHLAVASL